MKVQKMFKFDIVPSNCRWEFFHLLHKKLIYSKTSFNYSIFVMVILRCIWNGGMGAERLSAPRSSLIFWHDARKGLILEHEVRCLKGQSWSTCTPPTFYHTLVLYSYPFINYSTYLALWKIRKLLFLIFRVLILKISNSCFLFKVPDVTF